MTHRHDEEEPSAHREVRPSGHTGRRGAPARAGALSRASMKGGKSMDIVTIVVVVLIVLFVLGYFGRARLRG
jgi:hypothetical protein